MKVEEYLNYNGIILKEKELKLSADNRSFRYGDGCFETMKLMNGDIQLSRYHFERLFASFKTLHFKTPAYFTHDYFSEQIKELTSKNNHSKQARIRLTVFRGDGDLIENNLPNFIIQTRILNDEILSFNENGLSADIYPDVRKSCDKFSNIKSNNYLPYIMAALWANENGLDEAFVMNCFNRIAESTIANIFLVKNGKIKTPALSEGCVNGIMRKHLIKLIQKENILFEESMIDAEELFEANEIFLTNAIKGIRWIKNFQTKTYTNELARFLHSKC